MIVYFNENVRKETLKNKIKYKNYLKNDKIEKIFQQGKLNSLNTLGKVIKRTCVRDTLM